MECSVRDITALFLFLCQNLKNIYITYTVHVVSVSHSSRYLGTKIPLSFFRIIEDRGVFKKFQKSSKCEYLVLCLSKALFSYPFYCLNNEFETQLLPYHMDMFSDMGLHKYQIKCVKEIKSKSTTTLKFFTKRKVFQIPANEPLRFGNI